MYIVILHCVLGHVTPPTLNDRLIVEYYRQDSGEKSNNVKVFWFTNVTQRRPGRGATATLKN